MKFNAKKLAAFLLAVVMVLSLFPTVAFAGEAEFEQPIVNAENYGLINKYHVGTQAVSDAYRRGESLELNGVDVTKPVNDLPSSYDSRSYNLVTSVKNQNPYGSCWAHAAVACIESYMIKYGIPVGTGSAATTSLNLSETQHCWFNYTNAYDAEGMTTGDKSTPSDSCLDQGGNGEMSAYTFMRWTGAASESAATALAYSNASSVNSSGLNSQYAYQYDVSHVQNSEWIPGDNIAAIKQAIMDYGAGNISYYETGSAYTYSCTIDTSSQSSSSHKWANHAITLIGWDDSIAASNFKPNKPSGSGAWLCKNSWGTSYFNQGYCWISYEDTSVLEGYIYFYDSEPIDNYQHNYQYDGSCNVVCYGKGWPSSEDYYVGFANDTKVANVFTAKGNEVIRAVAFCNWDEAMTYTVEIYKNPTTGNPSSGTLMTTQTGYLTFSGYYTIPLDNPVSLGTGDTFSVVITQNVPTADDSGNYIHTPYDATFNNSDVVSWCSWVHANHGDTSYYKEPNGSWTDCPDNGDYRIKAFTDDVTFNLTAVSNNTNYGTVSVNGSTITASPAAGYYVESCTLLSGNATWTINGNTISVAAEADCTIQVNFAPKPLYTVNFVASGVAEGSQTAYVNDAITLPNSVSNTAAGWNFAGWMDHQINETTEKPTYYAPGASYTVTSDATLYAVYTRVEAGTGGLYYELVTAAQDDWSGRYVITYSASTSSMYVMKGVTPSSNGASIESSSNCSSYANSGVTVEDTEMRNVADTYIFTVEPSNSYYTVRNVGTGSYLGLASNSYLGAYTSYTANYCDWTLGVSSNAGGMKCAYSGSYPYLGWSSSNYFWSASSANSSIRLWKETNDSTTYYWTDPVVAEHEHEMVYTAAVAPTCGLDGHIAYYQCSICGKYFIDAAGENEITLADTVIPATGDHTWGDWSSNQNGTHSHTCTVCGYSDYEACTYTTEVIEPTATEQGYTLYTCTVCGYNYQNDFVAPLGENFPVHFSVPAGVTQPADMISNTNTGITLPTVEGPEGYTFLGWVTEDYDNVDTRPAPILSGNYVAPQEITLKALFSYVDGEGSGETVYQLTDTLENNGKYILVDQGSISNTTGYAVGNAIVSGNHYLNAVSVTVNSDDTCTASNLNAVLWQAASTADGFTFYNAAAGKYMGLDSSEYLYPSDTALAWLYTTEGYLNNQVDSEGYYYLSYSSSGTTRYTTSKQGAVINLYQETTLGALIYTTIIGEEPEPDPVDVYFVDQDDNAAAFVYAFGSGVENAPFPGVAMTALGVDENGDNYYKVTLDRSVYTNVIFSGGASDTQTANLGLGDGDYIVYYVNSHTGYVGADVWPAPPVVVEPSCTEAGSTTYTGLLTGETHVNETPALGHDYVAVVTEPSCTEAGYTTYTCSRCGDSYTADETPALGHDYQAEVTEPSCTEGGFTTFTCSRCGDSYTADETPALGHDYVAVVTPPTATEQGYTTHTCSRCGDSYVDSYTDPTGPVEPIETTDLHIYSSISVGTDMIIGFTARKTDLTNYADFWIEIVKHDPDGDVSYSYGKDVLFEGASTWGIQFKKIYAKEMGIDVEARLYAKNADGQIYMSPETHTNIRDYLGGRLTAANNKVEQRVLAADMLNYGAAAQMFMDFQTDHLVNEELTEAQLEKLHEYETKELPAADKTNSNTLPQGQPNILFTSVTIGNEVLLGLTIRLNESAGNVQVLVREHKDDGTTGDIVTTLDATFTTSTFLAAFNGIGADKMRTEYDFVTLVNGVETGNIRTWSLEGYVGEIRAEGIPLKVALGNALLNYGDSAAAYFAAQ